MLDQAGTYVVSAIVTLFVVFNPLGVIPFYQGLTSAATDVQRNMIVNRATIVVVHILAFIAVIGDVVLGFLGITLHYIMIAGGLYILVFAVKQALGGSDHNAKEEKPSAGLSQVLAQRLAIVPLATPLLAGPGAIATVMHLNDAPGGVLVTILAIVANAVLAWLILRSSNQLSRLVGSSNLMILNTMMNILMAAIGVAFMLKGVSGAFGLTFT